MDTDYRVNSELSDSDLEEISAGMGKRQSGQQGASSGGRTGSRAGGWGSGGSRSSGGYGMAPAQAPAVRGNCAGGACR
jgi:hypothetical protein